MEIYWTQKAVPNSKNTIGTKIFPLKKLSVENKAFSTSKKVTTSGKHKYNENTRFQLTFNINVRDSFTATCHYKITRKSIELWLQMAVTRFLCACSMPLWENSKNTEKPIVSIFECRKAERATKKITCVCRVVSVLCVHFVLCLFVTRLMLILIREHSLNCVKSI